MLEEMVVRRPRRRWPGSRPAACSHGPCAEKDVLLGEIRAFNRHYLSRGLCLLPLRFTEGKALLYLYRPAALQRDLRAQTAKALLADADIPAAAGGGCVARLVRRMREGAEFPHEVGLFLSYPPEDVKGFIENHAANAKCTGVWKVYGDERQARQTFDRYKKCTQTYCERWRSGVELDPAGGRRQNRKEVLIMKKTAVIYWSGTGNTEAMANAVAEGMREAGAECAVWTPADVSAEQ